MGTFWLFPLFVLKSKKCDLDLSKIHKLEEFNGA